jgi:hypothetical protein
MSEQNISDRELIRRYREMYSLVYVSECYGVSDLVEMGKLAKILIERGYEVSEETHLVIRKKK